MGTEYVYKIYGMHYCFNVVTENVGFPAVVIIRAGIVVDPVSILDSSDPAEKILRLRAENKNSFVMGPGRLYRFLEIDTTVNTTFVTSMDRLHFEDLGVRFASINFRRRIGVSRAVDTPWRFTI